MLERVELRNFRGFSALDADLQGVTVVVGPNSSGKTTLLHAIRIALHLLATCLPQATPRVEVVDGTPWIRVTDRALLADHSELLPLADWRSLFFGSVVGEEVSLRILLRFEPDDPIQEIKVVAHSAQDAQLEFEVWVLAARGIESIKGWPSDSEFIAEPLRTYLGDHLPRAVFIPSFYGVVRQEEYRTQAVVNRLLGAGDQSHIVRNLVTRLSNDSFERLNRFLQEALGARLVYRTPTSEVDACLTMGVEFRDDNGTLELSAAGAGLINLVALYSALERYGGEARDRRLIYLLDEPEAHLHPRLQGDMAHLVSTLIVKQFGAQVVMATHAVEIINRLAVRDDAILLRVDRSSRSATVLRGQPEIVAELDAWADMTPFSAINFLASRRVIFHEGKTDARIIRRCAELRYRSDLRGKDRFDAWTFAELEGAGNSGMSKLLQRLIDRVTPSSEASAEALRVLTVLDRDHHRSPGWTDEDSEGMVRARTLVWERHSVESMFLTPPILEAWLGAWLGDRAPLDLDRRIQTALDDADQDETLNRDAQGQLQARLLRRGSRGDREVVHAFREAGTLVEQAPATWQRGKDRSRFVLGRIRDGFEHEVRRQMPTELSSLLERVDLSRFGDVERPIPPELRVLLDWMTSS